MNGKKSWAWNMDVSTHTQCVAYVVWIPNNLPLKAEL